MGTVPFSQTPHSRPLPFSPSSFSFPSYFNSSDNRSPIRLPRVHKWSRARPLPLCFCRDTTRRSPVLQTGALSPYYLSPLPNTRHHLGLISYLLLFGFIYYHPWSDKRYTGSEYTASSIGKRTTSLQIKKEKGHTPSQPAATPTAVAQKPSPSLSRPTTSGNLPPPETLASEHQKLSVKQQAPWPAYFQFSAPILFGIAAAETVSGGG
ncbi:hypothetical protein V8C40DRAFT_91907 [Trichoderma camerunense]